MFFIESRPQVWGLIKGAEETHDVPSLVIPYSLFIRYPLTWTISLLDEVLPHIDKIGLILEGKDHRGRLLDLITRRPSLPWLIISSVPLKKTGLYLWVSNPAIVQKALSHI